MTRYWRMPQVGLDPPKLEWVEGWVGGELTAAGVHSGCHGLQPVARELSGFLTWKLAMPRQHTMRHSNAPQYNGIRFVVSLAFALVVGSLYYKKGQVGAGNGLYAMRRELDAMSRVAGCRLQFLHSSALARGC